MSSPCPISEAERAWTGLVLPACPVVPGLYSVYCVPRGRSFVLRLPPTQFSNIQPAIHRILPSPLGMYCKILPSSPERRLAVAPDTPTRHAIHVYVHVLYTSCTGQSRILICDFSMVPVLEEGEGVRKNTGMPVFCKCVFLRTVPKPLCVHFIFVFHFFVTKQFRKAVSFLFGFNRWLLLIVFSSSVWMCSP